MGAYQEDEKRDDKYWKKSGQIPAFGNWDYENELPITQYFESARQAGLIRFSNVSDSAHTDLKKIYALHFHHCNNYTTPNHKVTQAKEHKMQPPKEKKKSKNIDYLTEPPKQSNVANKNNRGGVMRLSPGNQKKNYSNIINVKAVDEDLYKIPPELLHSCKRKKRLGFLSRCLVPACMV